MSPLSPALRRGDVSNLNLSVTYLNEKQRVTEYLAPSSWLTSRGRSHMTDYAFDRIIIAIASKETRNRDRDAAKSNQKYSIVLLQHRVMITTMLSRAMLC